MFRSRLIFFLFALLFVLIPFDYATQNINQIMQSPSSAHWLGTDILGRDRLARWMYGGKISVLVGILSSLISLLIGTLFAFLCTSFKEIQNRWFVRLLDVFSAIPSLLVASVFCLSLDNVFSQDGGLWRSILILVMSIGLVHWTGIARLTRGHLLEIQSASFYEASKMMGASPWQLFYFHGFKKLKPILFELFLMQIPINIVYEGTLSFIGLGVHPPHVSLGMLFKDVWTIIYSSPL